MNCLQYILSFHTLCCFQTNEGEKHGPASKSEIKRWFMNNGIEINFDIVRAEDPLPEFIKSVVLFPKNKKKRTTLWYDDTFTLIQVKEEV